LDKRTVYYDHEPAYQRLRQQGDHAWRVDGKTAPFASIWKLFTASQLLPPPPARVLDFGCGGGQFALMLARKGYEVVGIDFAKTAIKMARENAQAAGLDNVRFFRRDALHPRLRPASFDAIVSINVLHCLIGPDRATYWRNIRHALAPGGVTALTTMVDLPASPVLRRQLRIDPKTRVDQNRTRCFAPEKQILAEAAAAGLTVIFRVWKKDLAAEGCDDLILIAKP
jgi:2-polyprenyl-3-methyl-5-hydroxy-6-metoxy-1,4-benzoquinol methylase